MVLCERSRDPGRGKGWSAEGKLGSVRARSRGGPGSAGTEGQAAAPAPPAGPPAFALGLLQLLMSSARQPRAAAPLPRRSEGRAGGPLPPAPHTYRRARCSAGAVGALPARSAPARPARAAAIGRSLAAAVPHWPGPTRPARSRPRAQVATDGAPAMSPQQRLRTPLLTTRHRYGLCRLSSATNK